MPSRRKQEKPQQQKFFDLLDYKSITTTNIDLVASTNPVLTGIKRI